MLGREKSLKKALLLSKRVIILKPEDSFWVTIKEYISPCDKCDQTGEKLTDGGYNDEYGSWHEGDLEDIKLVKCFDCDGTGWKHEIKNFSATTEDRQHFEIENIALRKIDIEIKEVEKKLVELRKKRESL